MTHVMIILQILFISLGSTALGLLFNHFFGLTGEKMKEFRENAKSLQERLKNAQAIGDPRMMQEVQADSMELTKEMMKGQFIPLCGRCFLFIGIFIVLSIIYAPYTAILPISIPFLGRGWFALYFLFSLGFSLLLWLIRIVYRKITGKEKATSMTKEMMGMLSPSSQASSNEPIQYGNELNPSGKDQHAPENDSWKEKL